MTLFEEEHFLYIKLIMLVDFLWRYTDWAIDFPISYDIRLHLCLLINETKKLELLISLFLECIVKFYIWFDVLNMILTIQFRKLLTDEWIIKVQVKMPGIILPTYLLIK